MRGTKFLLAVAVVVAVAFAIVRGPWRRCRCNREKRAAETFVDRAASVQSDFARQGEAARFIPRLGRCAAALPDDWELFFLLGSVQQIAGRSDEALSGFRSALELERRPEIYYNISLILFDKGDPSEAMANAQAAALFNVSYADAFDPQLKMILWRQLQARRQRLGGR